MPQASLGNRKFKETYSLKKKEIEKFESKPRSIRMVSFQCDACSDVVKKPKLDQHGSRCNSSFTCLDCSQTFSGPIEWKGHTTCISEAQKYEKSVYRGPKNNNTNEITNGHTYPMNGRGRGRGRGRGGGGGGGGFGQRQPYLRYEATGSNDTPLGTPNRMQTPVVAIVASPEEKAKAETNVDEAAKKAKKAKRKAEEAVEAVIESESKKKKSKRKEEEAEADRKAAKKREKAKRKAEEEAASKQADDEPPPTKKRKRDEESRKSKKTE